MATLIVSNDWDDLMKIIKSLEESGLLIRDVTETIKVKHKNKGVDFSVSY